MSESLTPQGRILSGEGIDFIRELIADNPSWKAIKIAPRQFMFMGKAYQASVIPWWIV